MMQILSNIKKLMQRCNQHYSSGPTVTSSDLSLIAVQTRQQQEDYGFKPRKDLPAWRFSNQIDWSADPFSDVNWRYQLHAWRMMDPILLEHEKSPNPQHLNHCMNILKDWAQYHKTKKTPMSYHDMATGLRASRIAFFQDQARLGLLKLSPHDKRIIKSLAKLHIRTLLEEGFIANNNHGYFQLFGLKHLSAVNNDRKASLVADVKMQRLVGQQFTKRGTHKENSPSYHYFTLSRFKKIGLVDTFPGLGFEEIVRNARKISPDFVFPDGSLAAIGDTCDSVPKPKPHSSYKEINGIACGYYAVRSRAEMLFFTGMAHNATHKHADDLSFTYFCDDEHIFIDSGKYGYQNDKWRDYFTSADAHNTIGILNKCIGPKQVLFKGSLLHEGGRSGRKFFVRGTVQRPKLFDHTRRIDFCPGNELNIQDYLKPYKDFTFTSSLHLADHLTPDKTDNGFKVKLKSGRLICATASNVSNIEIVRGKKEPILGWYSPSYLKMEPISVVRAIVKDSSKPVTWNINLAV
ncbi:heparinase II/III family protein [Pseudovibrio sp. POLY-S9]|uniref:heparinase II/III domain-containing protein n=1 Tax=Pseudovibrio sp. POLY-S9 TaxID=1576596 RepID=UPI00070EAABE|nr:heparinase II/III family protein [Pseudovibrio sp. POLY-S9]